MIGDNKAPENSKDGFQAFYKLWSFEQNQHLDDLITASKLHQDKGGNDQGLSSLVERVIKHYEQYYTAKSQWAKLEVLAMLSPPWRSSFEDAFLWIGGWRPSMAFHLLYSKSGLQHEACMSELMQELRLSTSDLLGDLSQCQLSMIDELQRKTIWEENHVTQKMAKLQETMADNPLVELSHIATEMMRDENGHKGSADDDHNHHMEQLDCALSFKEENLEKILHKADDLRLKTLKSITYNLTPIQAVHFLIAAAELHLRVHDWGKKRDALLSN